MVSDLEEERSTPAATAGSGDLPERETRPEGGGDVDLATRAWWTSAAIALFARVVLIAIALMAAWLLEVRTDGPLRQSFTELWHRWDARHFIQIAEHGYLSPLTDRNAAAFFPLFPLMIRAFLWIGADPVLAGMAISAVASVIAGAFLYRLAEEEEGAGAGWRALVYLTFFPTGVFLVAPYSEALFLAGAVPAFYLARRRQWAWVGVPAAVAMGARAAGLFLLAGLAAEFLRQRDLSLHTVARAGLSLVVACLPLLGYGAFLAQATGDPFAFLEAQREGWGRDYVGPISSFMNTWRTWDSGYETNWTLAWRLEIVAAAIGIAATVWAATRREWGYLAFMGTMLISLLTSSWYFSVPRMLLSMFPIPLMLASITTGRQRLHEGLVITSTCIAVAGTIVFTQGKWFY